MNLSKLSTGPIQLLPGIGLILLLGASSPAFADMQSGVGQSVRQRIVTVTGQGKAKVKATEANVNLSIEADGKTTEEVQTEVARRANAVVNYLRSQKVRNLQSTRINLNPTYRYNGGQQTIVGYRASNSVRFTVDSEPSGTVIDQAVRSGASRVGGVSFNASEVSIDQARKQALQDATREARSQADAVLSALGFREKDIVSIEVNGAIPRPVPVARQFALESAEADAPPSPVVAGEQTITASVTLHIRY